MVDFIQRPKRRSYADRLKMVAALLNQRGSLTPLELSRESLLSPDYCRRLLAWFPSRYGYAVWDEDRGILYIPGREEEKPEEEKKPEGEAKA
jgi:hypothetical protein